MAWWERAAQIGGLAATPFTGGVSLWPTLAIGGGSFAAGQLLGRRGRKDDDLAQTLAPLLQNLQTSAGGLRETGQQFQSLGLEAAQPAIQYLRGLLSGSPAALQEATAPERGRVIDQYDTARRAMIEQGPRGGGTTSALATSRLREAGDLATLPALLRRDAAGMAGQMGTAFGELGLSADRLASANLDSVIRAVLGQEELRVTRRGQTAQVAGGIGEALGSLLGLWLITRGKGQTGAGGATGTTAGVNPFMLPNWSPRPS
jgi:hypothetical protein